MSSTSNRVFEDKPAVRERVPVLVGLVGPSGAGKTYSAMRLATGIQRVSGGDIWVIDTEARRSLHYADIFKFRYVGFSAPFSPLDYLAAIEHCIKGGAKTIIVDSMSHEHEGPGGVLEEHDLEVQRLMALWKSSAETVNIPAWTAPKAKRRRLINSILQMQANFIFCFRAKEKVKIRSKAEKASGEREAIKQLGFMPIAGEEFVYEMMLNCLLLPGCGGVPSWHPEELGEKATIKLPEQFKAIFEKQCPLSEEIGVKLAEWAAGGAAKVDQTEVVTVETITAKTIKQNGVEKAFFIVHATDGRDFGTLDPDLADMARSCVGIEAAAKWVKTPKGGLQLMSIEPVEIDVPSGPEEEMANV